MAPPRSTSDGRSTEAPLFTGYLSPWQARDLLLPVLAGSAGVILILSGLISDLPAVLAVALAGVGAVPFIGGIVVSTRRARAISATPFVEVFRDRLALRGNEFAFDDVKTARRELLSGRHGFRGASWNLILEFADGGQVLLGPDIQDHRSLHQAIISRLKPEVADDMAKRGRSG